MSLRALLSSLLLIHGIASASVTWAAEPENEKQEPSVSSPDTPPASPAPADETDGSQPEGALVQPLPPVPERDLLTESAIRYGTYQAEVGRYNRQFSSQNDIVEASKVLGTHNPEVLASGWFAYSALLASESDQFAREVLNIDAHYGRDRIMLGLEKDMTFALRLDGSQRALGQALKASQADSTRLKVIGGGLVDQSRGTLQSLGWAKAKLKGNPDKIVEELKLASLAGRPIAGEVRDMFDVSRVNQAIGRANTLGDSASLWDNVSASAPGFRLPILTTSGFTTIRPFAARNPDYDFINARIMTLAAYRILGETGEDNAALANAMSDKGITGGMTDCLDTAQLAYRGCVYANHFVFERAFCIGQHAVTDVGACIEVVSK